MTNRNKINVKKQTFNYGAEQRSVQVSRSSKSGFFSDVYYNLLSIGWLKFFFYITIIYIAINLIFGTIYFLTGPVGLTGNHPQDNLDFFVECFFFSIQTFSTIGYGTIAPIGLVTNIVVSIQALVGMLSIGLTSGLFFSRFTRPSAKIMFSDQVLITNHLGSRCLVFRLANSRINTIVNAQVSMTLSYAHITPEGSSMRLLKDLNLIRSFNSIFYLNWVVAHPINDQSPLYNVKTEDLEKMIAEIMVSISGIDQTFSQPIHAGKIYTASQVLFDRNFEDMIIREGDEFRVDLDKISVLR